ncbi:MAG: hypothetical protein KZQ89_02955 [Candidatus Thiodiazotropha sp. (ex Lucinoma kastoroae)]|nr:hypothetical protein [Candidatus Thiodiazotropha sp. (ex Lucinoma kastoroae)]
MRNYKDPIKFFPVTQDMISDLKHEIDRTGKGSWALFNHYLDHKELNCFSHSQVSSWLLLKNNYLNKNNYDLVMFLYKSLPDKAITVKCTKSMVENLRSEKNRTNTSYRQLWEDFKEKPKWKIFNEFQIRDIEIWSTTKAKSVNKDHYYAVVSAYKTLPDSPYRMVKITKKMKDELIYYKNLTEWEILALKTREIKKGNLIFNEIGVDHTTYWTNGKIKKVCFEHYNQIIEAYKRIPVEQYGMSRALSQSTRYSSERMIVDEEFREKMSNLKTNHSKRFTLMLKYSNVPTGISDRLLLNITNGKQEGISFEQYAFLESFYEEIVNNH